MKFGIGFGQDSTVHEIGEQARIAEDLGFSHATYIDMGNLAHDVYVMMTLIALSTETMHVGQGVADPVTHNPAVMANTGATLRELTGDRTFVGLGVGGPYGKPFIRPARINELRDDIKFIKTYTAGEEAQLGEHSWHSEWIRKSHWAGKPVPVYLAVCGPRTCQVAGEVTDACMSIGMDVVLQKWRKEIVEEAALSQGRDPSDVGYWIRTQVYLADSKAEAFEEAAPYAATCALELYIVLQRKTPDTIDLAKRIEQRHPGLVDELKAIHDAWDPYYTERMGGPQCEAVTQRVVDFFLATGTIDDIGEQLQGLDDMGVTGLWPVLYSIKDQVGMMQEIGKQLIPRFTR